MQAIALRFLGTVLLMIGSSLHAAEAPTTPAGSTTDESAAESNSANAGDIFQLRPVVIDTQDGTGATLGLEFLAKGAIISKDFSTDDTGDEFVTDSTLGDLQLEYEARGTVAVDRDRNPKDFIAALLKLNYYFQKDFGTFSGGGLISYETDQDFDDKQSVYGIQVTYAKMDLPFKNDIFAVDLRRNQIDPTDDKERSTVLGTTSLDKYYRTDVEVLYIHTLNWKELVQTIEFNYRYFRESSPPAAIEAADIDRHQLITYRIGLPKDFFIAYSTGKLPFDRKDDRIFEIGLSYKLQ